MKELKIDVGIPVPPNRNLAGARYPLRHKYPLKKMNKGDSFYVPDKSAARVGADLFRWAKLFGIKLTIRQIGNGSRVWRIK